MSTHDMVELDIEPVQNLKVEEQILRPVLDLFVILS